MEKTALNVNIKDEQKKAQELINSQGLRVLVCAGTGCVATVQCKLLKNSKNLAWMLQY